tara:strand:+ start:10045 stop:11577 length:1533 start_codon:yes stop_codon:yes gene_type:complete
MRLLTREQARELDNLTMVEMGIEGKSLMGNAGKEVSTIVKNMIVDIDRYKIFIICGKGNNGGDGFSAAAELFIDGFDVEIHSLLSGNYIAGDARFYYQKCIDLNIPISYGYDLPQNKKLDLILDALLGTGFFSPLKKELIPWIKWINASQAKVVSLDIASGLDSNSGLALSECVKPNTTITFGNPKIGMIIRQGKRYSGRYFATDIGFPNLDKIKLPGLKWELFDEITVKRILHKPKDDTDKYNQGKVLVIAGSEGMTGAAILSSMGALRSGCGLTITVVPESLHTVFETNIIEGMTLALPDNKSGYLVEKNLDEILVKSRWADALIIGPGLGRNQSTQELIRELVLKVTVPIVLDADGLYPFASKISDLNQREYPLIITPHLRELGSLLSIDSERIKIDFPRIMTEMMESFKHIALIKQVPICIFNNRQATINSTGNPGLATAGTGDILSGMIGGFLASGINIKYAAGIAAFIHGKASDELVKTNGYRGQIATDILSTIPKVIASYEYL